MSGVRRIGQVGLRHYQFVSTSVRTLATAPPVSPLDKKKRRNRIDALLFVGGLSLCGGVFTYKNFYSQSTAQAKEPPSTFTIPVHAGASGSKANKTLSMLTAEEVEQRLKEHEAVFAVSRPGNPVYRYDTSYVSSNSPCEDDSCVEIRARDASLGPKGDLMFFGVFDGHAGWQTSRLLSQQLVRYLTKEFDAVLAGKSLEYASLVDPNPKSAAAGEDPKGRMDKLWSLIRPSDGTSTSVLKDLDANPQVIQAAIVNAFKRLDHEIVNAPIRLLEKHGVPNEKLTDVQHLTPSQMTSLQTLLPAMSGSCALLTCIDTARNTLNVAVTGDSRAVMGVWEPSGSSGGRWRVEVLTDDQTGRNESEAKRMRSEHPEAERDRVIMKGRVLGGLEPTRAFGDARYKWAKGVGDKLQQAFFPGRVRPSPNFYETPPYVTVEPVVTHVDLPAELSENSGRRFIVMATDGLWDRLNNDEVVGLVGAWLDGVRTPQSTKSILSRISHPEKPIAYSPHVPDADREAQKGGFLFEDDNLATHLIRNALGGASRSVTAALLSIPAPLSRRYRDDITCTIILLGEGPREVQVEGVRRLFKSSKL